VLVAACVQECLPHIIAALDNHMDFADIQTKALVLLGVLIQVSVLACMPPGQHKPLLLLEPDRRQPAAQLGCMQHWTSSKCFSLFSGRNIPTDQRKSLLR